MPIFYLISNKLFCQSRAPMPMLNYILRCLKDLQSDEITFYTKVLS